MDADSSKRAGLLKLLNTVPDAEGIRQLCVELGENPLTHSKWLCQYDSECEVTPK